VIVGGTTVLDEATIKLLQPAAEAGDASAQFALGVARAAGKTVPQDRSLALMWFSLAAGAGYDDATFNAEVLVKDMNPDEVIKAVQMARDWMTSHARQ
jgi:TPR repeat protein